MLTVFVFVMQVLARKINIPIALMHNEKKTICVSHILYNICISSKKKKTVKKSSAWKYNLIIPPKNMLQPLRQEAILRIRGGFI